MAAKKKSQLKLGPLGREFQNMLDQLEARIAQKGLNMTVVCTEAGIARANPVRWRQRLPNTIQHLLWKPAQVPECPLVPSLLPFCTEWHPNVKQVGGVSWSIPAGPCSFPWSVMSKVALPFSLQPSKAPAPSCLDIRTVHGVA